MQIMKTVELKDIIGKTISDYQINIMLAFATEERAHQFGTHFEVLWNKLFLKH